MPIGNYCCACDTDFGSVAAFPSNGSACTNPRPRRGFRWVRPEKTAGDAPLRGRSRIGTSQTHLRVRSPGLGSPRTLRQVVAASEVEAARSLQSS